MTKLNLNAQQTERDLRDELASVVPKQVYEKDREKLSENEHQITKYKVSFTFIKYSLF